MTVSTQKTLWCDHETCLIHIQVDSERAVNARFLAAREGWSHHGHKDYCPRHKRTS